MQIANLLGVEKHLIDLERKYESGGVSSAEFGNRLVPLLREAGFTKSFLDDNFSNIQLDAYAADVIQESGENTFLVTSSPNYFIDRFCVRYGIGQDRYICSQYGFDDKGLIVSSISPCGPRDKELFVRRRRDKFDLTIGVGNSIEQDGPFMSVCDIPILFGEERRDYLSSWELYSVLAVIRNIKRRSDASVDGHPIPADCREGVHRLLQRSEYGRNVFIMTPYRLDARFQVCINAIKGTLQQAGYIGYLATDHTLVSGGDLWQNVKAFLHGCKYGIALIAAQEKETDNTVIYDPDVFNPNVMAEIGYMMGHSKQILVLKDERMKLPTDWLGKLFADVNFKNPEAGVTNAVRSWVQEIKLH